MLFRVVSVVVVAITLLTCWLGLNFIFLGWMQDVLFAGALASAVTLNIGLVALIVRRKTRASTGQPASSAEKTMSAAQHLVSADNVQSESAFTLGVAAFEPPEKAWLKDEPKGVEASDSSLSSPSKLPVSQEAYFKAPVKPAAAVSTEPAAPLNKPEPTAVASYGSGGLSVESAFRRGLRDKASAAFDPSLLERFREVCLILKQANLEVDVWTDLQLEALAKAHLDESATTIEMVRLLIPGNLTAIDLRQANQDDVHARLFQRLLVLTGKELEVTFVSSSKQDGRCELRFKHAGRPLRWRFSEDGSVISASFMREATQWIARQAGGRFFRSTTAAGELGLLYLPQPVIEKLDLNKAAA